MATTIEVHVPDIGDFDAVPVIEVLVAVGDRVDKDQSLVTLESEKATMEVPSSAAGTVKEVKVKVGDKVAQGAVIAVLEAEAEAEAEVKAEANTDAGADLLSLPGAAAHGLRATGARATERPPDEGGQGRGAGGGVEGTDGDDASDAGSKDASPPKPSSTSGGGDGDGVDKNKEAAPKATSASGRKPDIECALLVLGAGPGGYSAAFRAADLDVDTVLIERHPTLGGVCLNVGCIPSKTLLHAAAVIDEAQHASDYGVDFGKPKIALDKLRDYKKKVVDQLTNGLAGMAKQRKVRVVTGSGRFVSANEIEVTHGKDTKLVRFEQCIIAAGSQALKLPGFPWDDERIMDSTDALELAEIPKQLLVVGGGIIGLEMATVFRALGSEVTVVELAEQLMPGTDPDLVKPLAVRLKKQGVAVHLNTKVVEAKAQKNGIACSFDGASEPERKLYDRVLVAVGRSANGGKLDADKAGVEVSDCGLIAVDAQMRSNVPHIFAIGDLVGQPMLAHKATHEGHVAAEVAAGLKREWVARVIPSVAYTDPEIAWVGVTEGEAKEKGLKIGVGKFPWAASGRAIGIGRTEGFTKLIFDTDTHRVIGGGIVGVHAGELIAEIGLAIEMSAEAADIGHTIHPHPTLSESVGMAAEVFEGTITDLYIPKKK